MRIVWPTVGAIIERVVDDARRRSDPFEGLRRIGTDEISHRRGQRYITVVVDHDSGRLLWAAPGRDQETVGAFFKLLGPQRCAKIELVSADAGAWIANAVAFIRVAKTITEHLPDIEAALEHHPSNARVEAINTRTRERSRDLGQPVQTPLRHRHVQTPARCGAPYGPATPGPAPGARPGLRYRHPWCACRSARTPRREHR